LPSLTHAPSRVGFLWRWPNGHADRAFPVLISSRMNRKCGKNVGTVGRPREHGSEANKHVIFTANSKAAVWFRQFGLGRPDDVVLGNRVELLESRGIVCNAKSSDSSETGEFIGMSNSGEGVRRRAAGVNQTRAKPSAGDGEVDGTTIGTNGRSSGRRVRESKRPTWSETPGLRDWRNRNQVNG